MESCPGAMDIFEVWDGAGPGGVQGKMWPTENRGGIRGLAPY